MKKIFAMVAITFVFNACGGSSETESNKSCVDQLPECETSQTVCVDRYVRSCTDEGASYQYDYCAGQICNAGNCQAGACVEAGAVSCKDNKTVSKCLENMKQMTNIPCEEDQTCVSGECVTSTCTPGGEQCAWKARLVCSDDGIWLPEDCEDNEYCDPQGPACVPIHPFCLDYPLGRFCADLQTPMQCSIHGKVEALSCGATEVCVDGFCQPKACSQEYLEPEVEEDTVTGVDVKIDDAVLPDDAFQQIDIPEPDIPELEKPPKAEVTINGGNFYNDKVKFTINRLASYIHKDKTLQVRMGKGTMIMEIHFLTIEEGVVGLFSSDDPGSVEVAYFFNDGSILDDPEMQWKYQVASYNVVLEEFGSANDGRVRGTFSGILADQTGGEDLVLTDGLFDVPRKE